jgi:hypothetical protein
METPLSIIVPTCDRSRTLHSTLTTLSHENYASVEILVSDNASKDETSEVINQFIAKDNRFRKISIPTRLSMSQHWELALSHATGNYVSFVGDDDGIMPNGCKMAHDILQSANFPPALVSLNATYYWPDTPIASHANLAIIPDGQGVKECDAVTMLSMLRLNRLPYNHLPGVYRGWVSRSQLAGIKSRTRTFFRSCQPDIYSGVAVASSINTYLFAQFPLFIEGVSGFSNGARSMQSDLSSDQEFFAHDTIKFHPSIPFCTAHACLAAESLQQAHDAGLISKEQLFEPQALISEILQGAVLLSSERYNQCLKAVRQYACSNGLTKFAEREIRKHKHKTTSDKEKHPPARLVKLPDGLRQWMFDTKHVGCRDVKSFYDLMDPDNKAGAAKTDTLKSIAMYYSSIKPFNLEAPRTFKSHMKACLRSMRKALMGR